MAHILGGSCQVFVGYLIVIHLAPFGRGLGTLRCLGLQTYLEAHGT